MIYVNNFKKIKGKIEGKIERGRTFGLINLKSWMEYDIITLGRMALDKN